MINLRAVANNVTQAINPNVPVTVQISDGYTVDGAGTPQPRYILPAISTTADVQQLTARELAHMDDLNIQGNLVNIYLNGKVSGIVRKDRKGGDLITVLEGVSKGLYLTTSVSEQWGAWVKVVCTLQNADRSQAVNC
jgi:hypothetical protein